ncbi:MAG: YihA family ribosome biogenesis GTP-binding protein [Verrucomicrobiaceae bacterium]|nr:MAG: YihA family ribosome biogenesis GTP-binding protein [Verrucomicrobiaceae bacterium]
MRIKTSTFLTSSPDLDSCPEPTVPEVAFIGRSNVGKSSLLNLLTGRESLAKVSSTPGHTQLINFFNINDTFRLVDLPGYGYAKPLKHDRFRFQDMIVNYITGRVSLQRVLVLIDSRHSPHTIDVEFVQWLQGTQVPLALVFTKTDKLKPAPVEKNIAEFLEATGGWKDDGPPIFRTSIKTREGRGELLSFMGQVLP